MLLLSVVLLVPSIQAQQFIYPPTEWTYPPNIPPNQGGTFFGGFPVVGPDLTVYVSGKLESQFHNYYYLFAFSPDTGKVKWQKQLTFRDETPVHPVWVSDPAVGPNGVVYLAADGRLYAINPDSSVKWQYEVGPEAWLSMPAVAFDGTVYVGTTNQLLALTPDGTKKWAWTDPNNLPWPNNISVPAIGADGTIYVTRGDMLYAIKPDGKYKWSYAKGTNLGWPIIGHNGTVYVASSIRNPPGGFLIGQLDAVSADGQWKWTQALLGAPRNPVIGPSGDLYLGTDIGSCQPGPVCGYFYAIRSDGDTRWVKSLDKAVASTAAVADFDRVLFSVADNQQGDDELYVLAGGTGDVLAQYNILEASTAPVLDLYGHIYISTNGKFWAIEDATMRPGEKSAPAISPWPLARQWLRGTGTAEDLAKKWEFRVNNPPVYGNPSQLTMAADGTVYINRVCLQGQTYCPQADALLAIKSDGQKKWEYIPDPLPVYAAFSSPVVVPDGTVYVGVGGANSGSDFLFAIGPNGAKKWAHGPLLGSTSQPAVGADGTIYMIERSDGPGWPAARLHAINPLNGTTKWTLWLGPLSGLPPVVGEDGRIYAVTAFKTGGWYEGESLHVVMPDGTVQHEKPISEISLRPTGLIMGKGSLYVAAGRVTEDNNLGSIYSYSLGDKNTAPALKWVKQFGGSIDYSPSIGGTGSSVDILYVPAGSKLYALEPIFGLELWEIDLSQGRTGNHHLGSPTVGADGTIYVAEELQPFPNQPFEGGLWAVNPNGTMKWRLSGYPSLLSPGIAPDGTIYVIKGEFGDLLALKGFSGGLAPSSWPTLGHDMQRTGRRAPQVESGNSILIEITDPDPQAQPTSLLFETILSPGWIDLTIPTEMADPPPPGYLNVDPLFVRDLQTTAVYTGTVETCFDISQLHYFKRENLRVFHFEGNAWVDRTSPSPGIDENRLCASVESFSQFAIFQPGTFTGFFPPVANLPKMNQATAGQAIPVKFSLGGDQGYDIFTAGYPASQRIDCTSGAPLGAMVGTAPAGSSGLSYDAAMDQYVYAWKTDKAWVGTCRQLIVSLNDGSDHRANFKFK